MAKRISGTTPKADGFRMPGEFEAQEQVWMIWPERPDIPCRRQAHRPSRRP